MDGRKFRSPRLWSNRELRRFAYMFDGKIVNVSGWQDSDKEGSTYKSYFRRAREYWVTNYTSSARGFQGNIENEVFLDLTNPLPVDWEQKFDVVFNHTVLEHIFEFRLAFSNLCLLSKDIVIVVVPFLQEQHAAYGDFWRFTPQAIDKLFKENGFELVYLSANDVKDASIYIFAIGARNVEPWKSLQDATGNMVDEIYNETRYLGRRVIGEPILGRLAAKASKVLRHFFPRR